MNNQHRRSRGWWTWAIVAVAVAAGALVVAYRSGARSIQVETAVVTTGPIRAFVEEQATMRLTDTWTIAAPFDGRIIPVETREGDVVSSGQVLARMESEDLRRLEAEAVAAVGRLDASIAENDDARLEALLLEQAKAMVSAIERAVEAAQERVRAGEGRAKYFADRKSRTEASGTAGAATELEVDAARLDALESDAQAAEDRLVLRASEAILLAGRIGPRFVAELVERKALSRAVLERERAEAEARLAKVRDDIARADIVAPVDGMVLDRAVTSRRFVLAGTPIIEVGRSQDLEVEVELLSDEAARVVRGMTAEVVGEALGGRTLPATVKRVHPRGFTKVSSLGVEQQRVIVELEIDDAALAGLESDGRRLGPGYRVRARIVLGEARDATVVPRAALFRDRDGAWTTFVVRDGRARRVPVEVGIMNDAAAEVTSGLSPDDRVVLAPPIALADGDRVRE